MEIAFSANEIIERFEREGILLMKAEPSKKAAFYFEESIERFIEYAKKQRIDVAYYTYMYHYIGDYLITEENVDSMELSEDEYNECIDEIEKYNQKLKNLPFDKPYGVALFVINQGMIFVNHCTNDWLESLIENNEIFEDSDFALERIMNSIDCAEEIEERRQKKETIKAENEKQIKRELFEFFLDDTKFSMCTNRDLRIEYCQSFAKYNPTLNKKVESLFTVRYPEHLPVVTERFLRGIVEKTWKMIKNGITSSDEAVKML